MWPYLLIAVGILWLTGLTLLLAALIRHVGALQLAVQAGGINSGEVFDVDTDGPTVGSELPERTIELLREAGLGPERADDLVVVFLSSSCVPCWERANEIVSQREGLDRTVFLVSGGYAKGLAQLRTLFERVDSLVVWDPTAREIVRSIDVKSTPFAFRFSRHMITDKAYLRNANDFKRLLGPDASVESAEVPIPSKTEVPA